MREFRDLPQRRCRRALDPSARQRALPRDHDRARRQPCEVLMLDASASEPDCLYGAIEVGGTIRSTDGGEHWENLSHGQYITDDRVDMHGVLTSRWRPGTVFAIARAGMFRSSDGGDHWSHVPLEPLNGQ